MSAKTLSQMSSASWRVQVRSLPSEELQQVERLLTPKLTPYVKQTPTPPQTAFLLLPNREALYGGAAGGGKSSALLSAALQYVDVPGYSAVLFRKSYADLARPGALMDRAHEWLRGTAATWNEQRKAWRFPSGATLTFGYLENANDVYAHQGAEYQFVGFDELTQHEEKNYRYLFSRMRRLKDSEVPVRMRTASNPGGTGHQWVFNRYFVEGPANGRIFIPAKLEDNPHLDAKEYESSLNELDPVIRAQLRNGDWSAIDRSNAIVPEFTPELKAAIVRDAPLPDYFTPYGAMDVGSRDLTVFLFGYHHFIEDRIYVVAEVVLKDPSTRQIGEATSAVVVGTLQVSPFAEKPRLFCDVDPKLIRDLRDDFGLRFQPTPKTEALEARNATRALLGEGRIHISPSCKVLLATLEGSTWNDARTDYARNEHTGHADAWDALVYLVRNVARSHNPAPKWEAAQQRHLPSTVVAPPSAPRAVGTVFRNPFDRKKR